MKTAVLACLLFFIVLPAFAFVPLSPAYGTNDLATMRLAADLNATKQSYFFVSGKLNRMEREMDRLETGFLILSIVVGSAGVGVCLLSARDAIRRWRPGTEKLPIKPCAENAAVQPLV
ncbi:MAG: hypothetical protein P4L87_13555 [Formivibrio sp.]|nr:hypothetical protein [Formivibrio sp.]